MGKRSSSFFPLVFLCFKAWPRLENARHLIRGMVDRETTSEFSPIPPSLLGPIKNQNIKFPPPPNTACPPAGKNSAKITTVRIFHLEIYENIRDVIIEGIFTPITVP